jgi:shikimate dehydrogenase
MQQLNISSNTRLLGLFGYPSKHSLSPDIQNKFLRDNNIDAVYLTFEFPEEELIKAFEGAKSLGLYGINITMPYKEKIYSLVDKKDKLSAAVGSVNTIKFKRNRYFTEAAGFNTDIVGFTESIKKAGHKIMNKNCLITGAGGAARSAVFAFLREKAEKIFIYNRTAEKAENLLKLFDKKNSKKIYILYSLDDVKKRFDDFDIICNCTPIGMDLKTIIDKMPLPEEINLYGKIVFETIYNPVETKLLKKAREEGAMVVDGLDMLINQAASSFKIWFGIMPETRNLKDVLLKYTIKR